MTPLLFLLLISLISGCEKNDNNGPGADKLLQITSAKIGTIDISSTNTTEGVPVGKPIVLSFSQPLDTATVEDNITMLNPDSSQHGFTSHFMEDHSTISIRPVPDLEHSATYSLMLEKGLKSQHDAKFNGLTFHFSTERGTLRIQSIRLNGQDFSSNGPISGIDFQTQFRIRFNAPIEKSGLSDHVSLSGPSGDQPLSLTHQDQDSTLIVENQDPLTYYRKYTFSLSQEITTTNNFEFKGFHNDFYTRLDSTDKFPRINEEKLLTKIQEQTFKYFWDFAHPNCGLARERNTAGDIVTTGGSGFGIMSIIVGIERGFISRDQGLQRLEKILSFLENEADRFHGAWPHWMDGTTGEVIPFGEKDDGADLVETAFLVQGLLAFREYLDPTVSQEKDLIDQINRLWEGVEWDWYTQGKEVLYWHWSPNYGFEKNLPIRGHNETQIVYILAAASPSHPIDASVYHNGYAKNGAMQNGNQYYGYTLPLGNAYGGPLFFTHYSYLGLDPRNLEDHYADYWKQNRNHALIHHAYCKDNPQNYIGYSGQAWGLTASDNHEGYSAHSPTNDLGVITPTAAVSSLPYTPQKAMAAIKHYYYQLGDRLWGPYGFYDAFSPTHNWWADSYIAIDQGPIICMIENHRTALLWDLFMSAPEIQSGLDKLGFTY